MKNISEDNIIKEEADDSLRIVRVRLIFFPIFAASLLIMRAVTLLPFSNFVFLAIAFSFVGTLLSRHLIKKSKTVDDLIIALRSSKTLFLLDMLVVAAMFYFLMPLLIVFFGSAVWISILFYIFYSTAATGEKGYSYEKRFSYYFFILSYFCWGLILFWEYLGVMPYYESLAYQTGFFFQRLDFSLILLFFVGMFFVVNRVFNNRIWEKLRGKNEQLRHKTQELERVKAQVEREVEERTKQLKKLKDVLEIQVKARVKEVEETAQALRKDYDEKTEELRSSKKVLMNILDDVEIARKRAEEERDKTLAIINNFADGLLVFDCDRTVFAVNPTAEDFFGIKRADLIGKSVAALFKISVFQPLKEIIGAGIKEVYRKEFPVREGLTLEVSTISMKRKEGILGTLVAFHDITREKLVEEMKTEFVSISAHQLRTPLSAIKWTLKMLLEGDLGKISEEQKEFLDKTYQSNERMIKLINDLLNITRIEEGKYLYASVLVDIQEVIQSVIDSLKKKIKRREIKFEFRKPKKKIPKVKLDIEKIKLAIQNLIENALEYTLPRGIVTVSLKYVKKKIEFSVEDKGIGIPKNQQKRIFTKFFRGDNAVRMETEGTGLGLYIAKNIIEAHGGKIWFKSEEKRGSTFYFTLPSE